ncbi:DNA polymerase I [Pontibacillus litoralis]|uniref:DNA polymerase I n=1 Tax=Pontibacillus litoralis JSM 072002 TaxID=1385512 RepID=A0A0A5GDA7_9BACI|nr:DNA polymerase I [Pontibacillus litoralis]KGX89085.1 DNA polymerase I [Pontibacillus litoralis JSM 072002]
MTNKLILIDGNSIAYRAFFALPLLNNDKGVHTNAVYGFTTMLLKILEEENPTHMLVAFDAGKTTFRHKTYEAYKGGRQKTPPELSEQLPILRELLDAFNISHYELPLYEADDIIGTLARKGEQANWEVKVISGDRDLLQLVSERVTVALTKKGITNVETYTPEYMKEKMEISPEQVIDLKALMGDSSDNIPGVPGVGEKTAVKLLKQFTTLENVFANVQEVSGKKLKEKLETHQEDAFMSKELVTIHVDTPIETTIEQIGYQGYDVMKLNQLFRDLGFHSLINRIEGEEDKKQVEDTLPDLHVTIVDQVEESMLANHTALVIEMLGENYHEASIVGISIAHDKGVYFIPADVALQSSVLKQWLEDEKQKKMVFDAKKATVLMKRHGIDIKGIDFDLLIASYLINPAESHHDIPSISHRLGETSIRYDEEVYGKGAKLQVPEQDALSDHIARKAHIVNKLKQTVVQQLKDNDQWELYHDLELPLTLILADMEHTGVSVDVDRLKGMGEGLQKRLAQIQQNIYELAGETFNLNSPKQLGPILFEKLQLPVIKKTKTGYSTSADVLEQLEDKHPIISEILLYRQLGKLQSTYIEGLLKVVDDTGKIHTRFNQALTQTGRLSSTEPNLQNIPIRLEEGRKIRQAFIPSQKGWKLFAADYSQIELRVLAHIANDEKLIQAFNDHEDIHTKTAMDVFHVEKDQVTDQMRRQAKAVNFGIVYGISDFGLSQSLGITRKEAKTFIDRYLQSYPGVQTYMDDIVQDAKQKGYVTTLMNRRRYLPDITSRNFNRRSFAERTAMNTPIQGTAADIIKKAMIDLYYTLAEEQLEARMLLQVHDELIIEAPEHELDTLKELVANVMEQTVSLHVPLVVDYAFGDTWYDAK